LQRYFQATLTYREQEHLGRQVIAIFFSDLVQIDMTLGNGIAGDVVLPFSALLVGYHVPHFALHRNKPNNAPVQLFQQSVRVYPHTDCCAW